MPILTIELSDEAYCDALSLPAAERRRVVAIAFAVAANTLDAEDDKLELQIRNVLTAEDLASIGRGIADNDAGRVHDGDTVLAELRTLIGLQ